MTLSLTLSRNEKVE